MVRFYHFYPWKGCKRYNKIYNIEPLVTLYGTKYLTRLQGPVHYLLLVGTNTSTQVENSYHITLYMVLKTSLVKVSSALLIKAKQKTQVVQLEDNLNN